MGDRIAEFAAALAAAERRVMNERKKLSQIRREARAAGLDLEALDLVRRMVADGATRDERLAHLHRYVDQLAGDGP